MNNSNNTNPDKTPWSLRLQANDLSGPLLLLASDLSDYMTGSTLVVDGGHLQSSL